MISNSQMPRSNCPDANPAGGRHGVSRHGVLIVGTGFSGLCMGIKLREQGETDFVLLERADDVGGTWRDNTYPGCACDVPSHVYSFSFAPNPNWSRMYAPQREIHAYLKDVAEKNELLAHIRFGANVTEARYDDARRLWVVSAEDGRVFEAPVLVSGMGGLSNPLIPEFKGLETFTGPAFHSAQWRHDVDLTDKRVAVIGTGASAIQFVPAIASQVQHLHYFQRTPPWVLPKDDRPLTPRETAEFKAHPWRQVWARTKLYWLFELRFLAFKFRPQWMKLVAKVARHQIARSIHDEALRSRLTPDYTPGCKRLLISNDYYPALARTNVSVITDGIQEITPHGVVTADGVEHPVDAIIFGTGFKVQDPIPPGMVFGKRGLDLAEAWQGGPQAYLGISIAGFPNFFMLMGPNTGLGHNSMVFMIESQAHYIAAALQNMKADGIAEVDVKPQVQARDVQAIQKALQDTVWNSGCKSWYVSDSGRNTAAWPGFTFAYRLKTRRFKLSSYQSERA